MSIKDRMDRYYPNVVRNVQEFRAIIDGEYPEFNLTHDNTQVIIDNAYLTTMDESRIIQWENALNIIPLANSSIEDRRATIIARIRGSGKLNTALINRIVAVFTGGTAISYIQNSALHVEIQPPPSSKSYKFKNVENELKRRIPAHLGLSVTRSYQTWNDVKTNHATWDAVKNTYTRWRNVIYDIR